MKPSGEEDTDIAGIEPIWSNLLSRGLSGNSAGVCASCMKGGSCRAWRVEGGEPLYGIGDGRDDDLGMVGWISRS